MTRRHGTAGNSLVEIVVLITIVSLAVPPMATLIAQSLKDGAQSNMLAKATCLAKSMMEEVLSKNFEDPQAAEGSFGTEEGNRIDYDDVDDYDNHDQSPPTDCRGGAFAAYAPFRVQVTVNNVADSQFGGAAVTDGSTAYKRVTVRVSWDNGGRSSVLTGLSARRDGDIDRPPVQLTFLSRENSSSDDLEFRVRNDSDQGVYLTNVIATWGWPTAYYEYVWVRAIGYMNYGNVWKYDDSNYIRMESGGNAMFNNGDVVYLPSGTTAEIRLRNFRAYSSWWGWSRDVNDTEFSIEIWAGPDHCVPFTVPAK